MSSTMAPFRTAAPVRLLPAPLGRIGMWASLARLMISTTSCSDLGLTTTAGAASKSAIS